MLPIDIIQHIYTFDLSLPALNKAWLFAKEKAYEQQVKQWSKS